MENPSGEVLTVWKSEREWYWRFTLPNGENVQGSRTQMSALRQYIYWEYKKGGSQTTWINKN